MALEIQAVRGVTKNYGVRKTGGANGQYRSDNQQKTLSFKIDRQFLIDAAAGAVKLNSFVQAGHSTLTAKVVVHKAFSATAAVNIGTAAQGDFPIAAGQLGTVGAVDITPTVNLVAGKVVTATQDLTVKSAVAGTLDGEAELVITYLHTVV